MTLRSIRCPACGHEGEVPRSVPTMARLRCGSCGERSTVGECRPRRLSERDKLAQAVLARLGPVELDDDISDMFRGKHVAETEANYDRSQ